MYEPKEFKAGLRTDEEICKLIYEDDMPLKTKYSHILYRGEPMQKLCVYRDLPKLYTKDPDLFAHLIGIIKEMLPNEREEIIVEAAKPFLEVLEFVAQKDDKFGFKRILLGIIIKISQIFSFDVQEFWNDVFTKLLETYKLESPAVTEIQTLVNKLTESSELTICKENGIRLWAIMVDNGYMQFDPVGLEVLRTITHEEDDYNIIK
jgi:hypothetical protein